MFIFTLITGSEVLELISCLRRCVHVEKHCRQLIQLMSGVGLVHYKLGRESRWITWELFKFTWGVTWKQAGVSTRVVLLATFQNIVYIQIEWVKDRWNLGLDNCVLKTTAFSFKVKPFHRFQSLQIDVYQTWIMYETKTCVPASSGDAEQNEIKKGGISSQQRYLILNDIGL